MRLLVQKVFRDLWHVRWRAVVVVLTVASGVGIFVGAGMAITSGFLTRDALLDRMHFADLEVQFLPEDEANLPDLSSIPGVAAVERRLVLPGTITTGDGARLVGVMVFLGSASPALNSLEVLDGTTFDSRDPDSAVIERSLARYHRFAPGGRIQVTVGKKVYDSRIDGIVTSPEYLVTTANPEFLVPERGSFGVVFSGIDRVSDALGFTMVNDLLFRWQPGTDPDAARAAVLARLDHLNVEHVIPRTDHFMYRFVQIQMEAFQIYTPCIMAVMGVLACALTLIAMLRLVLEQRREIGTLIALGYTRRQIIGSFAVAGLVLGAAGGLLGAGLALVLRNAFAIPYAQALGMPDVILAFEPGRLLAGAGMALTLTAIGTTLPIWWLLRLAPSALMRDAAPERTSVDGWHLRALRRVPVPLAAHFGIRNVFRRPVRSASIVAAVALSLGVPVAFTVSLTSALETPRRAFGREAWTVAVDFLYPVPLDEVATIAARPGVTVAEPYLQRFVELESGNRREPVIMVGGLIDSRLKSTTIVRGRTLSGREDEIVISDDLARRLQLRVGDAATLRIRSGVESVHRVVGITGDVVTSRVLLPLDRAQALTGMEGESTGVYLAASGESAALRAELEALDFVGRTTSKAGVSEAFQKLALAMVRLINVNVVVSLTVALLFIVMSINLVIGERQTEYATFKCLGYSRRSLWAMVAGQALAECLTAAILAVPIAAVLAVYLNLRVSQAWHPVSHIFRVMDFVLVLLPALLLVPLAAYPGLRLLDRLHIAQVLGGRRIG
jgi:putative ABC transport system permease protein